MAEMTKAFRSRIRQIFPWFTSQMMDSYSTSYSQGATADESLRLVRQTSSYQQTFRGNYDAESGEVRMDESEYFASKARFDATLLSLNVNPDYFEDQFVEALENEVSPAELEARAEAAYERIIDSAPAIRAYYSENFGIDMSDSAIIASVLNPKIGEQILDKRLTMAEIGGAAARRGFTIATDMARDLAEQGLGLEESRQFFGEAANTLPGLSVLAARHADPDDEFDLEELTQAMIFDDPEQRKRIRRLVAQEQSTFSGSSAAVIRSQQGGMSGLAQA